MSSLLGVATGGMLHPMVARASSSTLTSGQWLYPGQSIVAPNGDATLTMQSDGNLVIYKMTGMADWNSGTSGYSPQGATLQSDRNLVVYFNNRTAWSTNRSGNPGDSLAIQNDGNLVIYTANNTAIWASNTGGQSAQLQGESLRPGQALWSVDGYTKFTLQTDGNLVLYSQGTARWWSGTAGDSVNDASMQSDGNFVIYNTSNQAIFATNSAGYPGAKIVVQNDENVVIYQAKTARWATNTWVGTAHTDAGSAASMQDCNFQNNYARAVSGTGNGDIGTAMVFQTPPNGGWSAQRPNGWSDEAVWLMSSNNSSNAIETGYGTGISPVSPFTNGLVPYYTLDNGQREVDDHQHYLSPSSSYTAYAVSGGRVQVGPFTASFSYTVGQPAVNFAQGEADSSGTAWMMNGSSGETYTMYWSPDGSNWYVWGFNNDCHNNQYFSRNVSRDQYANGGS